MHRAVLFAEDSQIDAGAIDLGDAAAALPGREVAACGSSVGRTLAEVERDLILGTLSHCLGNRTHAATMLGISIRTMRNKLRQYSDEGYGIVAPGPAAKGGEHDARTLPRPLWNGEQNR